MKPVIELITAWEEFTGSRTGVTVEDFCHHYLNIRSAAKSNDLPADFALVSALGQAGSLNKVLCKMALKEFMPDVELEHYFLLHSVNKHEHIRKGDVISINLMLEPTTSIDILNRMIKAGLLQEKADPDDKRARLLSLTRRAKDTLPELDRIITEAAELLSACLSPDEKAHILPLVNKYISANKDLLLGNHTRKYSELKAIGQDGH